MAVIVQKFGGTSVANAEKIRGAASRAVAAKREGYDVVVVVSARGHKTDELVDLAKEITNHPRPREMDMLLATGEQESVALMAMAVHELGEEAISLTGAQIGVLTDTTHTKARIVSISTERMQELLKAGNIVIAAGFQGVDTQMNITTLGRGGSDTTATALAAVLNAELCEIYTDVEGVFTTDPRVVKGARKVERISYDEMLELASLGASVMHSRSIEFAKKYRVQLRVRPAYSDGPGTLIAPESDEVTSVVTGVAFVRNEAMITLVGLPDQPGVMNTLFSSLSAAKIPVDMVVQNVAREGTANVTFTVSEDELAAALTVAKAAANSLQAQNVVATTRLSKVSVVGHGMQTHTGVAARMFQVLATHGINIRVVTTSEIKISVLIDRARCDDAVLAAHAGFQLEKATSLPPQVGCASNGVRQGAIDVASPELTADIVSRLDSMESIVVSDITADTDQSRVTLSNLPDDPGIAEAVFTAIAEGGVLVDMIVQNASSDGQATISFTVPRSDLDRSVLLLREVMELYVGSILTSDRSIGKISVAGIGLRSHTEVGARLFRCLAANRINVEMINTSELKLCVVISAEQADLAMEQLRSEFGLAAFGK
ncbi:MAG: aspartate kinase [Planctomycetaceae bacterium]|nr:aspartate kinase [Planctomycetaceae bacterium]